ncbi:Carbohydrate-selective porin, OprB family [Roseovarius gaetbuli]|uniref:Carbohydrate-selective porin, OprB family n=1 Tax=Roseovarius gaetbuli TaxID=1356575 RepID=A0A1X6ZRS2_9RHOB|nr:carbohydrate porin [Roseovarius gaetbuli]SLN59374.1 Carbohydrate-selective porin, OprB family [Roseovarius gaetbuli]
MHNEFNAVIQVKPEPRRPYSAACKLGFGEENIRKLGPQLSTVVGQSLASVRSIMRVSVMLMVCVLPADSRAQEQKGLAFSTPDSVEGTLAATDERQREGALADFRLWKKDFENRTGITFGFDNQVQVLRADSNRSPSNAASNAFRFYTTWTPIGRGTPNNGALVFKIENRSAIGNRIPTQALGRSFGYAGVLSSTFSDAGWILTNLYWRQRFANGRGSFIIGHIDPGEYVNFNTFSSPWTTFTNLSFGQQPTLAAPQQSLGAALQWRLDDEWAVQAGILNANADPSDPLDSAEKFFDHGETFKHLTVGWSPDWVDRNNQAVQLTFWQVDKRKEADVKNGHGVSFLAGTRIDKWRPFLRAGYADGGGAALHRTVSVGTGYDVRRDKDLLGLGLSWGRAPNNSRDQYTVEAFYRYDATDFFAITPSVQYIVDPVNDPTTDDVFIVGLRARFAF